MDTPIVVDILLVTSNAALIAEMMFDSHTIRKIALMRAKRRLNRMASRDVRRDVAPPASPSLRAVAESDDAA